MSSPAQHFSLEQLQGIARALLEAGGLRADHAAVVAEVLVWADLRGVPSHGVSRLPRYVEMMRMGEMNPAACMSETGEEKVFSILDADRAPGPAAMAQAMDGAVERARRGGIGMVLVRGTTHTGALGFYTRRAAESGMIAIMAAASGPNMAYHGSRAAGVSTSPLSIAAPSGDGHPVVFDMSSGAISLGKLKQLARSQPTLPEGLALDREGNPTTDSARAAIPMPMGQAKGSGLSLMIEIVTSILARNPILTASLENEPGGKAHRQNALALAIDVSQFCDPEYFNAEVQRLKRVIKSLPPAGDTDVLLPGERGDAVCAQRLKTGVPVSAKVIGDLKALAAQYDVTIDAFTPALS